VGVSEGHQSPWLGLAAGSRTSAAGDADVGFSFDGSENGADCFISLGDLGGGESRGVAGLEDLPQPTLRFSEAQVPHEERYAPAREDAA